MEKLQAFFASQRTVKEKPRAPEKSEKVDADLYSFAWVPPLDHQKTITPIAVVQSLVRRQAPDLVVRGIVVDGGRTVEVESLQPFRGRYHHLSQHQILIPQLHLTAFIEDDDTTTIINSHLLIARVKKFCHRRNQLVVTTNNCQQLQVQWDNPRQLHQVEQYMGFQINPPVSIDTSKTPVKKECCNLGYVTQLYQDNSFYNKQALDGMLSHFGIKENVSRAGSFMINSRAIDNMDPDTFYDRLRKNQFRNHAKEVVKRGVDKIKINKYKEGIAYFTEAISLDPNYPDAYFHRGNAYLHENQVKLAEYDLKKFQTLDPSDEVLTLLDGIQRKLREIDDEKTISIPSTSSLSANISSSLETRRIKNLLENEEIEKKKKKRKHRSKSKEVKKKKSKKKTKKRKKSSSRRKSRGNASDSNSSSDSDTMSSNSASHEIPHPILSRKSHRIWR